MAYLQKIFFDSDFSMYFNAYKSLNFARITGPIFGNIVWPHSYYKPNDSIAGNVVSIERLRSDKRSISQ